MSTAAHPTSRRPMLRLHRLSAVIVSCLPYARSALALALVLGGSTDASAATITVTDPGDAGSASSCTLRQALAAANADAAGASACSAGSGTDTLVFAPALANSTVSVASGELAITDSVVIAGSGQTIDGGGVSRVLSAAFTSPSGTPSVTLSNLNLANGYSATSAGALYAAGVDLTLSHVTISNSSSRGLAGGLAVVGGSVRLDHSAIANNQASSANAVMAGGMYAGGNVAVTLQASSITSNTAHMDGAAPSAGGVLLFGDGTAHVTVIDSTIVSNAISGVGQIMGGGMTLRGTAAAFYNSTIANNSGNGSATIAGGVLLQSYGASATQFTNCTIVGNSEVGAGIGAVAGGVLTSAGGATLQLDNTILSRNIGATPDLYLDASIAASARASLLGTALLPSFSAGGNLFFDNPGVLALGANGGPTLTMPLSATSPALNAGTLAYAMYNGAPLHADQRGGGYGRTLNGAVDIGAFQHQSDRIFVDGLEILP